MSQKWRFSIESIIGGYIYNVIAVSATIYHVATSYHDCFWFIGKGSLLYTKRGYFTIFMSQSMCIVP